MPLVFGPNFVEGKVYRSRKKQDDGDEEKRALKELQTILSTKNRKPCDCEAQTHDLLENCSQCGRLTCIAEGPGKCMHCENLVLSQDQRERLQQYIDIQQPSLPQQQSSSKPKQQQSKSTPSSSSSRTLIIDRQFDQFSIDNTKHLRAEDRRKLKENLDELQGQKRQTKLLLHVDVDNLEAGSKSVAKIDDFEGELRRLQLNCQPIQFGDTNMTLAELVSKENKIKYAFEYIEPVESRPGKQQQHISSRASEKPVKQKPPKQRQNQKQGNKNKSTKNQNSSTGPAEQPPPLPAAGVGVSAKQPPVIIKSDNR